MIENEIGIEFDAADEASRLSSRYRDKLICTALAIVKREGREVVTVQDIHDAKTSIRWV